MRILFLLLLLNSSDINPNMEDTRNELKDYTSMLMLFFVQIVGIDNENDDKTFVDKEFLKSKEDTLIEFDKLIDEIQKITGKKEEISNLRATADKMGSYELWMRINKLIKNNELDEENLSAKNNISNISEEMNPNGLNSENFNSHNRKNNDLSIKIKELTNEFIKKNFCDSKKDEIINYSYDIKAINEIKHFEQIENKNIIKIIQKISDIWNALSRKMKNHNQNKNSTLMNLKYPFTVPGGRFKEIYYWDSFWITDGQLVFEMYDAVKNCIMNFVDLINSNNFIPNGTRLYYKGRSQPPMFAQIVNNFYEKELIIFEKIFSSEEKIEILGALKKEYMFWMKYRSVTVEFENIKYKLNGYFVKTDYPRPESLTKDINTFIEFLENEENSKSYIESLKNSNNPRTDTYNYFQEIKDKENKLYSNIKAAAESGWDFSSRFFGDGKNMWSICTNDIIPVDLNAILYSNEIIISKLYKLYGGIENSESEEFKNYAIQREKAMKSVLWSDDCWYDYNYIKKIHNKSRFYFSNIMPMLYGIDHSNSEPGNTSYSHINILNLYRKELFGYEGGIPASGEAEKGFKCEQWDFPNVWAPHQHLLVNFLIKKEYHKLALHVAMSFYNSVKGNFKSSEFYEKYNCENLEIPGDSGEYNVQIGFGWTNGVIIRFIQIFKEELEANVKFKERKNNTYKILDELLKDVRKKTTDRVILA